MESYYNFAPPRRLGQTLLSILIFLICVVVIASIWQLLWIEAGISVFIFLILIILGLIVIPVLLYLYYALWGAFYTLEREGIHLHWGLRVEDIPMQSVGWIVTLEDLRKQLGEEILLPLVRIPGGILGTRYINITMPIEYMASDSKRLLFIGTAKKIYAISPNDPQAFLLVYQRYTELGSIMPIKARSQFPSFVVGEIWQNRLARYLLMLGFGLNLLLIGWVLLVIPTRNEIVLGFISDEPVKSSQLLLLPIVNSFFFFINTGLGLYFFRRPKVIIDDVLIQTDGQNKRRIGLFVQGNVFTILLWLSNIIASGLFLAATYFILLPG